MFFPRCSTVDRLALNESCCVVVWQTESDQLCGSSILNVATADLHTFAEHWGNFGLLQFMYALVDQATLLDVKVDPRLCDSCPVWYRAKIYSESILGAEEMPTNNTSGSPSQRATKLLGLVEEILDTKYAAVGILEDWDGSMRLFDHALRLPNYNWTIASAHAKSRNHNSHAAEEHEMLQSALTDPKLRRILWLDILLYDHAVSIHKKQLREHGLS